MIEHPPPTEATVKYLYAHAFRCAYQGCLRPLYRMDEQTGERTLNSRICHIHARREDGPRWCPTQSGDDNRSEQNLLLMCVEHANAIDEPLTLAAYPAELLKKWKTEQIDEYDRLKQGWAVDTAMAKAAIDASFSNVEIGIKATTLQFGGEGGKAPGAGGGGGGAIGRNSRGGQGGPGGGHRIDDGEYTLPWTKNDSSQETLDEIFTRADADPGFQPGAGGGGAGAIGDNARAGDGGGGGESVSALIDIVALKSAGLHHIEVEVGKGGQGARLPGQHSSSGEDSIVRFIAKGGTVLKTLRASGGSSARSSTSRLPDDVAELTANDINNGFRITTLMAVDAAEVRDGLLFILGGGWKRFLIPQLPCDVAWTVACTASGQPFDETIPLAMYLSLIHPDGHETSCQTLILPAQNRQEGVYHWIRQIGASFDAEGVWSLRVHSGGFLLGQIDIEVLNPATSPSP